ncbi:MAG: long-chain fatty acid--CoA ligase [Sphingobacteriales bacterium]|nr:MAG: long-chain fatty acid--CoA ligase [Sphingobacteriales bacterium]
MIQRIFDIVAQRAAQTPTETLFAHKEDGTWQEWTAQACWTQALQLAAGLQSLGLRGSITEAVEAREKIVIISPSRPEWIITDIGVQMSGAILTPLYPTMQPSELQFILKETGVRYVFLSGKDTYRRFGPILQETEGIEAIFTFDPVEGLRSWTELMHVNQTLPEQQLQTIPADSVATIIYTSGTTGEPKGVMLTHRNICANILQAMPSFTFAEPGKRALSFLPLNHVFERTISYLYLHGGLSIWYAEGLETIGDNLKEVAPIVFSTVPRLLEKVYEKLVAKGLELTGTKRKIYFWAMDLARAYDNARSGSFGYRMKLALADRLVLSKWRAALGGNIRAIVCGSAALQTRLNRIFSATGMVVMEGYGLTEASPFISCNRYESEGRRIGTIGPVLDGIEAKLSDDGEILVRGENIMQGYYKRPEQTAEVLQDGWLHTGDIGTWVEGRFLKITDRKKEIFKNSGGKYIAPQPIENKLRESPYIEQIMIFGAGEKYVSALIVPAFGRIRKWLADQNHPVPETAAELIARPEVKQLLKKQIDWLSADFSSVERVKKFTLLLHEWTAEQGELTPSLKLRRKIIEQRYAADIAALYST